MELEPWSNIFYYDETSPSGLRWKYTRYTGIAYHIEIVKANDVAGFLHPKGKNYRVGVTRGKLKHRLIPAHQIVWELHNGIVEKGLVIDHKDGNGTNNRIENLRLVTNTVNNRNRKISTRNKTGKTGVVKITGKYKNSIYYYYTAYWVDLNGKLKSKTFSILKYGEQQAFNLASDYRDNKIKELNKLGANYSERHGL